MIYLYNYVSMMQGSFPSVSGFRKNTKKFGHCYAAVPSASMMADVSGPVVQASALESRRYKAQIQPELLVCFVQQKLGKALSLICHSILCRANPRLCVAQSNVHHSSPFCHPLSVFLQLFQFGFVPSASKKGPARTDTSDSHNFFPRI